MVNQIGKNLEKTREESRQKTKSTMTKIGLLLLFLSIAVAAIFMYMFYISPKHVIDIIVVSVAIICSSSLFYLGLARIF
ncbi:MAG TPA: hypothetical protein ENH19_00010 [Actinobacteria bacterium]|nr:hypothetical protein [Actinomycetes bacterium]HEX21019.1 hypothetical protein [Actinomycetota bacterium]